MSILPITSANNFYNTRKSSPLRTSKSAVSQNPAFKGAQAQLTLEGILNALKGVKDRESCLRYFDTEIGPAVKKMVLSYLPENAVKASQSGGYKVRGGRVKNGLTWEYERNINTHIPRLIYSVKKEGVPVLEYEESLLASSNGVPVVLRLFLKNFSGANAIVASRYNASMKIHLENGKSLKLATDAFARTKLYKPNELAHY